MRSESRRANCAAAAAQQVSVVYFSSFEPLDPARLSDAVALAAADAMQRHVTWSKAHAACATGDGSGATKSSLTDPVAINLTDGLRF